MNDQHAHNENFSNFFHKHTHISTPTITPLEEVVAAVKNLTVALKGTMPHYLQDYLLAELTSQSKIVFNAVAVPELDVTPHIPVVSKPDITAESESRRSPRLTTHVNWDRQITAVLSPPLALINPVIFWLWYIQKALETTSWRRQQIRNAALLLCHIVSTCHPVDTCAPPPRVVPRRLQCLAASTPKVGQPPPPA